MFLSIKEAARRINRDIVVVQISDDESDEQNDVLKSKDCGDKHNGGVDKQDGGIDKQYGGDDRQDGVHDRQDGGDDGQEGGEDKADSGVEKNSNYLGRILQTLNIRLRSTTPFLEIQVRICSFLSRCIFFNTSSHVTVEV